MPAGVLRAALLARSNRDDGARCEGGESESSTKDRVLIGEADRFLIGGLNTRALGVSNNCVPFPPA
jgi:hypothetical protein